MHRINYKELILNPYALLILFSSFCFCELQEIGVVIGIERLCILIICTYNVVL